MVVLLGSLAQAADDWELRKHRFQERSKMPKPPGYPEDGDRGDSFAATSFEPDYEARRKAFLDHCVARPSRGTWGQMILAQRGLPVWEGSIYNDLFGIDRRGDCSDFTVQPIIRMLYQFGESGAFSDELLAAAKRTVLDFKYWPDEPGIDSMCSWSENHHILFSASGYLAGQKYPDEIFTNSGWTGKQQMERSRRRVIRWLDLRYKTGFSEWLSNIYYDEDIAPVVNLIDFAEDEEIVRKATMVLDLILADIACNSFQGMLGSTHGRSYDGNKKSATNDATKSVTKLCFGLGYFGGASMSGSAVALSPNYRPPRALYEIANDPAAQGMINRQRAGILPEEADRWGLGFDDVEDGMVWLSLEAYCNPKVFPLFVKMLDEFNWWENGFFQGYKERKAMIKEAQAAGQLSSLAAAYEKDLARNQRSEVNIYTYRTPDYMLSTAQDHRAGYGGDQQSIWQATLGKESVCFTTHPVLKDHGGGSTPGYWTGSGLLPRAAQIENVALIVYDATEPPALYVTETGNFTHAWLPRDRFDAWTERDGWIFARQGDGYLALWSSNPYRWRTETRKDEIGREHEEDTNREAIVDGRKNVWICELGRNATDGSFEEFINRIVTAGVKATDDLQVEYRSPSQGLLEFGWTGPLRQNTEVVELHDYPRYDNPFAKADFPAQRIHFQHGDSSLTLDWKRLERTMSE